MQLLQNLKIILYYLIQLTSFSKHMYGVFEDILGNLGYPGQLCLQRAVCEMREGPLAESYGWIKDIVEWVLTWVTSTVLSCGWHKVFALLLFILVVVLLLLLFRICCRLLGLQWTPELVKTWKCISRLKNTAALTTAPATRIVQYPFLGHLPKKRITGQWATNYLLLR